MSTENDGEKSLGAFKFKAAARGKIVTVEIGPEHKKYLVHAALLAYHSDYFKKALNGPWKEAEDGVIPLEDVDCETFDVFIEWLYTGKLPSKDEDWLPVFEPDIEWETQLQILWIKVCIFGDRFFTSGFQRAAKNHIIDALIVDCNLFYCGSLNFAFDNLPPGHVILRLLVDQHCSYYDPKHDTEENGELQAREELSHHFLVQVMLRHANVNMGYEKENLSRCDYHEHATDEERKACEKSNSGLELKLESEFNPDSDGESEGDGE